jgi:rSAM/selenodomain-associated transferase 2
VKLAVVIPALDEAEQIGEAVASARRAPASIDPIATTGAIDPEAGSEDSELEIIVVDGGSRDGTPRRAAEAGARVVQSSPGRARQLGEGVRASRGDVLLFLHADTVLPPGFDAAIAAALRDPRVVGGAFRFRFDRREAPTPALRLVEWGARLRGALLRMPYGDQALFVRRRILDAIGGVPQAPIMEDLDLVKAMKRKGRLALLPLPATTSSRRYRSRGVLRTALRHQLALAAWALGVDRRRVAAWYAR